ncbi:MAG: PAS domain-containing protein, partial [Cytophagales bacterium]|nr:PAS domain-containing protein [Cytophagales bacterium]
MQDTDASTDDWLRLAAQLSPCLIHVHRLADQRVLYANDRLTELLGYTAEEAKLADSRLLLGEVPLAFWAFFTQNAQNGQIENPTVNGNGVSGNFSGISEWQSAVRHKDGSERQLRHRLGVSRRSAHSQPTEIVVVSECVPEPPASESLLPAAEDML